MVPADVIAGTVTASPNPVPLTAGSSTRIAWTTNDPRGAELHVSTPANGTKLVARGASGCTEISWIAPGQIYTFGLFGASDPGRALDQVVVRRSGRAVDELLDQLDDELRRDNIDLDQLADFVARAAGRCVHSSRFPEFFRFWEEQELHITPVHFYQPIPDTRTLPESLWTKASELVGIDLNDAVQLDLLRNCFPKFRDEYSNFPTLAPAEPPQFYFDNGRFGGTDALAAYCMVRHFRPRTIIEIGSGFSSLISGQAAMRNGGPALVCVEPFPLGFVARGFPGLRSLMEKRVEDLELDFFDQLEADDFLFIDSSHTVKIGGDVNYLFLEVLPRLKPGVIVHVHDIPLPFQYRREWVLDEFRFWTEQYLLQAFLTYNSQFEVLLANSYLAHRYLDDLKTTFPTSPWWGGGSFWMRRHPN